MKAQVEFTKNGHIFGYKMTCTDCGKKSVTGSTVKDLLSAAKAFDWFLGDTDTLCKDCKENML